MPIRYPPARADDLVETLHGVPVPDPYRWLEEAGSPETRAWVDAQNALTRSQLDGPARDAYVRELTGHLDYARTTTLLKRGRDVSINTLHARRCRSTKGLHRSLAGGE